MAAKKSGAPNTAKIRKTVINVIVHIFLAILAFIWVLPIFWVILTSFRGEKGSYAVSYTHLLNYILGMILALILNRTETKMPFLLSPYG